MKILAEWILYPVLAVVFFGLSRLLSLTACICAGHRIKRKYDIGQSSPYDSDSDGTSKELSDPPYHIVKDYWQTKWLIRFLMASGLIWGAVILLAVLVFQIDMWYLYAFMGAIPFFCECMAYRAARREIRKWDALPQNAPDTSGKEIIEASGYKNAALECRFFTGQANRRRFRVTCGVLAALVFLLGGLQADYFLRPRKAGDGIWQLAGFQYRILDNGTAEVVRYVGPMKKIRIPAGFRGVPVTSIGTEAFKDPENQKALVGRKKLEEILLPDSLELIEDRAFSGCSQITDLTIPSGVKRIGDRAFEGCYDLQTIRLPDSLAELGSDPFHFCSNLKQIEISGQNPVFYYDNGVLVNRIEGALICHLYRNSITEYRVPDGIREIREGIFSGSYTLKRVILPEGLRSVGKSAFSGCANLEEVLLPDSLTVIGDYAFSGCMALKKITLPDGLTVIGESAFSGCKALKEIILPDSLTVIGDYAFSSCTALEGLVLPDRLAEIGEHAFWSCSSLTEVNIPSGVNKIGRGAFRDCTGLARVTIAEGVTAIGSWAFSGCDALESVTVPGSVSEIGMMAFPEKIRRPDP